MALALDPRVTSFHRLSFTGATVAVGKAIGVTSKKITTDDGEQELAAEYLPEVTVYVVISHPQSRQPGSGGGIMWGLRDRSGVRGHLRFAQSLAGRVALSDVQRNALAARVAAVERRLNDPRLYLAVIGEYSTGKSTFLNALLGADLLASAFKPTTSVATRIQSGRRAELRFQLDTDDEPFLFVPGAVDTRMVKSLTRIDSGFQLPGDLSTMLCLLTAHRRLSRHVVAIDLCYPSALLSRDVVLIDTPGTNADELAHVEIARGIMAEVSDAAVVTVRADKPVPESLVQFLTEAFDAT
jgi:hypothetical protein